MAWSKGEWASAIGGVVIHALNVWTYLVPQPGVARRACPLIDAVKRGDTREVRALLTQGADPNTRQTQAVGRVGLRRIMVDIPEELAKTALMLAASEGYRDIVELLLDSGAEVNAKAVWGETALTSAVSEGGAEIATLLIERGADVNAIGIESPLTIAATERRIDLVNLLLDNGADVNTRDEEGFTALMEPAGSGYQDVLELLLAAGIDVNARNNEGFTALRYAKKSNRSEIVDLLARAGAHE